jgi:hypothetical protein
VPRSNPARSPYCSTRHLLRNLQRPRELRRNPLTAQEFFGRTDTEALRIIGARVATAFAAIDAWPELRARQLAILLRVDTERHDPRRVAGDLGLSTRQFHRERRGAHDAFHTAYGGLRSNATVDTNFTQRLVTRATALSDSGETASADAILRDILSSGADAAERCEALTRLAEIEAWSHRFERARSYLEDAAFSQNELPAERRVALSDARAAAELLVRWFERGPAAVRDAARSNGHANGRFGRTQLVHAAAVLRNGEAGYAAQLLRGVSAANIATDAPEFIVDLLMLQAELADFTAENPSLSEDIFARAASVASSHGLRGRALYATHQLSLTRWAHSRRHDDRRAYRALVDRIDRSLPPRLRSYLIFSAADVELAIGDPRRALASAQSAVAVSTNRYESFSACGLAAGALLRLGRIADAGAQAIEAANAARAEGHLRVLSLAQRISAQANLVQRNYRAARMAIEESLECARKFSSSHALAQAQAIWGKIRSR